MNAGAYGGEMKDVLVSVTAMDREGRICTIDRDDLDLGYRHSALMDGGYIVEEGHPDNVISNPSEERTKQFLARFSGQGAINE